MIVLHRQNEHKPIWARVQDFIDRKTIVEKKLVEKLSKLTAHHFISKKQGEYFKMAKKELD